MSVVLESLRPAFVADARNLLQPGSLLRIKQSLALLHEGQILEVRSNDDAAHIYILAWARKSRNEYLGAIAHEQYISHFIQKRR